MGRSSYLRVPMIPKLEIKMHIVAKLVSQSSKLHINVEVIVLPDTVLVNYIDTNVIQVVIQR